MDQPDLSDDRIQTVVSQIFPGPAALRVLFAMSRQDGEWSLSDVIDAADVTAQTAYDLRDSLLDYSLIEESQRIGNTQLYRRQQPAVWDGLRALDDGLSKMDFAE